MLDMKVLYRSCCCLGYHGRADISFFNFNLIRLWTKKSDDAFQFPRYFRLASKASTNSNDYDSARIYKNFTLSIEYVSQKVE